MELCGKKILVTGASGFIGSHLCERLAHENELVALDDFSIGPRENLASLEGREGVRILRADITDLDACRNATRGVDVVFHLAISCLRTSLGNPQQSHDVNAGGSLQVCRAAQEAGVERFVYVSSSEIYGTAATVPMAESHPCKPMTVYGASKLAGELYALAYHRTYGLPVSVVRPFNTYGPREPYQGARAEVIPRFILSLLAGQPPVVYGDGTQTRDFTFVEDTVTGLVAAGGCDALVGDVVNLAFGREASILRVAELLAGLIGQDLGPVHQAERPGDVDRHFADTSKARELFGFEPNTDLETGLGRTLEWFLAADILARVGSKAAARPNW